MKSKIQMLFLMFAACFFAIGLFADEAEVLPAQTGGSWVIPSGRKFTNTDGYLSINGGVDIHTKHSFAVDPNAAYRLSGMFRTPGGQPNLTRFEFGFDPIDANGKEIPPEGVFFVQGTDSVLASPVNIGDTVIRIRNNGTWYKNGHIAFQTNPNYSDLPNRNTAAYFSIGNDGEAMTLSLRNPMKNSYPSGCRVRNHYHNRLVTGNRFKKAPYEWTKFSATIQGINMTGNCNNQWWPGTKRARVFILVPKDVALDFKNVTVTKISE